ncbi:MAG: HAMP domain-containing sensor histidine kinase, partial [Pseudomonadota bacterium]
WLIGGFFVGLSLPLYLLLQTVYSQLEREIFFQHKTQAEEIVGRIDQRLADSLAEEQQRPFAEYSFFNVLENPLVQSKGVTFSPLSELPPRTGVPGIVGYFQIDPDGSFHSPALPDLNNGSAPAVSTLSPGELSNRMALRDALRDLLASKPESKPMPAENLRVATPLGENEDARDEQRERRTPAARKSSAKTAFDALFKRDAKRRSEAPSAGREITPPTEKKTQKGLSPETLSRLNIDDSDWNKIRPSAEAVESVLGRLKGDGKSESFYRRKEKVEIPDQSAAGALFNRHQTPSSLYDSAESDYATAAKPISETTESPKQKDSREEQGLAPVKILSFESEIDPLQMTPLGDRHLCFYRRVWRDNGRHVQGFVVKREDFLHSLVGTVFHASQIGSLSGLILAHGGGVMKQFEPTPASGRYASLLPREAPRPTAKNILLYRAFLSAPLQDVELLFSIGDLPYGSGRLLVDATAVALVIVLVIGLFGLYRLGVRQIDLVQQQRNFVSAVSHELKTPLTSIRMYGELLRSGWVHDEAQIKTYYDYIFFESERLSRLIANVLQLAKLENHGAKPEVQPLNPLALLDMGRSKVLTQVEAAGFSLNLIRPSADVSGITVMADGDTLAQIFINLVDNALKFSADAKTVDLGVRLEGDDYVVFFVRDYGPGISRDQRRKIFRLFYRAGDELTRTKPGTGIGLALVTQLADQMNARIDLVNRNPGVEFQVKFHVRWEYSS